MAAFLSRLYLLSHVDVVTKINVLNLIQEADPVFHRSLECLAAGNQTRASCTFVDYRGSDSFGIVTGARGSPSRVDEPSSTHIAIEHLVST